MHKPELMYTLYNSVFSTYICSLQVHNISHNNYLLFLTENYFKKFSTIELGSKLLVTRLYVSRRQITTTQTFCSKARPLTNVSQFTWWQ